MNAEIDSLIIDNEEATREFAIVRNPPWAPEGTSTTAVRFEQYLDVVVEIHKDSKTLAAVYVQLRESVDGEERGRDMSTMIPMPQPGTKRHASFQLGLGHARPPYKQGPWEGIVIITEGRQG